MIPIMNTSDKLFIEFAREYRKEFGEVASDEIIMDAFIRLTNVLKVIKKHALSKRFDRPVALAVFEK